MKKMAALLGLFLAVSANAESAGSLASAKANYLLGCGGCHGIQGASNGRMVPDLRGQVGYFLNSPLGRAYLIQLPNVAFDPISDRDLAAMMNFVVFGLGGGSAPAQAKPFDAAEVGELRRHPLTGDGLSDHRAKLVEDLIARYGASPALRLYRGDRYEPASANAGPDKEE